jgi:hypothetical protein
VQHSVLNKLPPEHATMKYTNNQGGAENYVKCLMLQKASLAVDSPETMRSILRKGLMLFWHLGGDQLFTDPTKWSNCQSSVE